MSSDGKYFSLTRNIVQKIVFPLILLLFLIHLSNDITPVAKLFKSISFLKGISEKSLVATLKIFSWLIFGVMVNNVLDIFVWQLLFIRRTKVEVPKIIKQSIGFVVYFLVFAASLNVVLGLAVSDIITTSGFIGIVLGLALRPILTDYFAGIALNLEASFSVNEYVLVRQKGIPSSVIGCVKEITWRTTRIQTPENTLVVVPNSELLISNVTNLSRPTPASEFEIEIFVDYSSDLDLVQKVLDAALCEAVANNGPMAKPAPKARIKNIDSKGVCYKITFMVDPLVSSKGKVRHIIYKAITKHFQMSGLMPAAIRQEVVVGQAPLQMNYDFRSMAHRKLIIKKVDFFHDASEEEILLIAEKLVIHEIDAGETVISKGDVGDSMFIVVIGSLEVYINDRDESANKVANLNPGDVFGEISLLTGATRSATVKGAVSSVLYEVTKDTVAELFKMRPELMNTLAKVCVERKFKNENSASEKIVEEKSTFFDMVSKGIRKFFRRK